jgi:YD repeat-containing protein
MPDAGGEIVEGTRTVTTVNEFGRPVSQAHYERTRSSADWVPISLTTHSDAGDEFGRPTAASYYFGEQAAAELDTPGTGTAAYTQTTTYTNCRVNETTGRDGVTTDRDYVAVAAGCAGARVSRQQTTADDGTILRTQRYAYDAAGRRVESRLDVDHDGWDATLDDDVVTSKTAYDAAGRVTVREDAEGKRTFTTDRIIDVDFAPTAGEDIRTLRETRSYAHDAAAGPISVTWADNQGRMIRGFTAELAAGETDWNGTTGEAAPSRPTATTT